MSKLFIDGKAIQLIKKELLKENAYALRIFTGGGGCCKRFEITPVKKPLASDVTFTQDGIEIFIEKELVDNTSVIEIKIDENKGLLINLIE
jgi:Fe-S cluster assembly iron-binding protein IscA